MRKHDVRKWLHAILDLLPVILIPVFMIYSHRHTIDSGSIQVPQNQVVDFNQLQLNGNFESLNGWYSWNSELSVSDNKMLVIDNDETQQIFGCSSSNYFPFYSNHSYIVKRQVFSASAFNLKGGVENILDITFSVSANVWTDVDSFFVCPSDITSTFNIYTFDNIASFNIMNVQIFDLTQMFGIGNEPTLTQFNQWYTQDYYAYTLSRKELLKGSSTLTYDDTDIMSQVVYQLYNAVDKYFNMGNVFNLTGVYDWFNLNIFNGNAPISIYIVWNIVLYEFVMDLLFLLYGLFMWFIDMVEKIMDKPFKSIK